MRKIILTGLVSLLIVAGYMAGMAAADSTAPLNNIRIRLKETAVVQGPVILLGEIADIQAPAFFLNSLAAIEMGRSPKPGRMVQMTGTKIRSLLRSRGVQDQDVTVNIPGRVFIKRASQTLKKIRVQHDFETYLGRFFKNETFKLKSLRVNGLEPYPTGDISLVFDPRYTPGHKGQVSVHADVVINGTKEDRITVDGRVAVYQTVVVAARSLAKGTIPGPGDLRTQTLDLMTLRPGVVKDMDQVVGQELTTGVAAGRPVMQSGVKQPPVIHKGDVVKLVARKRILSIATRGVCIEDGYADRPVTVENLRSGKRVRGIAKKDGTVDVLF